MISGTCLAGNPLGTTSILYVEYITQTIEVHRLRGTIRPNQSSKFV
jgi:hypothetical protein